jgi:hypothetical protein
VAGHDTCANFGKQRVVCGFSWLLQVIDHEAVLLDPKLFSSLVHRSVALLKRRFGRQTSSRWRFSQNNDWIVQVIPQQAIKAILALSTRKMVIGRQKLGWHFLLRLRVFTAVYCAAATSKNPFYMNPTPPLATTELGATTGSEI